MKWARRHQQALKLTTEAGTRARIASARVRIEKLKTATRTTRGGRVVARYRPDEVKAAERKLRRLEAAFALRCLIGWPIVIGWVGRASGENMTIITSRMGAEIIEAFKLPSEFLRIITK